MRNSVAFHKVSKIAIQFSFLDFHRLFSVKLSKFVYIFRLSYRFHEFFYNNIETFIQIDNVKKGILFGG